MDTFIVAFETKFPSLRGKVVNKLKRGTGGFAGKGQRADYVETIDVERCCLDKEIVKKAIDKYAIIVRENPEALTCLSHLKFEFGLE